ncbi:MAG: asparagine synthase (glutamine-hydrolyzing) [Syntrophorhabdaceae bacterium]|nr:asparagine synthase (glutamine-hydrolyzing) [Syntrophorhabdaceae bacterium]
MCGFVTIINPIKKRIDHRTCIDAISMLTHRGPDASGEWISDAEDVYMGFRRLSIIDLSDAANQPMVGRTGKIIVFNGEIYNFRVLRPELESKGYVFRTQGDTEVLLSALEIWGPEALKRLEGMFSFVLWDAKEKKALFARDFFGIKPLYFWKNPKGGITVASEIKAFYALPDFEAELNGDALPEYMRFRCLCGAQTLLKDVYQVQPGELYEYDQRNDSLMSYFYWDVAGIVHTPLIGGDIDHLAELFLQKFHKTVDRHLIADVKVGTQFSGGVDSALTSAIAAKDLKAQLTGFHCHVPHTPVDEKPFASAIADHLGMSVEYTTLDEEAFFSELLEKLTWHMDEPVGHPNAIGVYLVSRLAYGKVKVLLSGEGADETFAGYYRYRRVVMAHRLRGYPFLLRLFAKHPGFVPKRFHKIINMAYYKSEEDQILTDMEFVHPSLLRDLFPDISFEEKSLQRRREILKKYDVPDGLKRAQIFDIKTYLPSLLIRQDKMSMAASIENRVPFLTPEICAFALTLPDNARTNGISTKVILKKALSRYLPEKLVYRTKIGFELPLGEWFLKEKGRARLSSICSPDSMLYRVFRKDGLMKVVNGFDGTHDPADFIWILLSLKTWMDIFLSGRARVLSMRG